MWRNVFFHFLYPSKIALGRIKIKYFLFFLYTPTSQLLNTVTNWFSMGQLRKSEIETRSVWLMKCPRQLPRLGKSLNENGWIPGPCHLCMFFSLGNVCLHLSIFYFQLEILIVRAHCPYRGCKCVCVCQFPIADLQNYTLRCLAISAWANSLKQCPCTFC